MLRIWFVFGLLYLIFFAIITRLFYWQIIAGTGLRAEATIQYETTVKVPATRGVVVTSDGSPLVINQIAYLSFAKPKEIPDVMEFVKRVSSVLTLPEQELLANLRAPGRLWFPLAKKIDEGKKKELENLGLSGLGFEKEPKRFYPEASMAAHLLGFVGLDEHGIDKGYFGLEGYYDLQLRGKVGSSQLERDVSGAPILLGKEKRINSENGRTLLLWLDKTIQRIAEQRLAESINKYGAKEGSVVILDPQNGGILAMATFPHYSPGEYRSFEHELYKNPIVATSYEPGSTFKVLIMAAALEERKVESGTTIDENGPVRVNEYTVRTWNDQYHGVISMAQVLQYSSNVGMVYVGNKIGKKKLIDYLHNFGFGELTGIDLQDEATPILRDKPNWTDIDLATVTFGQGIAVTPLQMVLATATLANGGWLLQPKVVKAIRDDTGKTIEIKTKKMQRVISDSTAQIVKEMMVAAVENGEAKWAKPKGYRIAGKTGTAQIPVAGHYDEKKTIASFVGFAPADNPRFVMLVTLREPSSSPWGSETAAPLFFSIAKDIFLYYGIAPSE